MNEHNGLSAAATALLVVQAQGGDDEAINMLYNAYFVPMKRFAVLRLKDAMISEDLVQNVWLKAARRITRLQNPALFRSWLFRALRWEILDWLKQTRPELSESLSHADTDQAACLFDPISLVPVLASLAESEREVVELHYLNGLSVIETALALDIPEGTVKSRLSRARDALRNTVYEEDNHED
ncbi:MAG: RNA polymerase sigma factor [Alteromonadaceae bacterium]|nr:RNA polymerase sigma factor [Alteromonadaceae bacterium]